MKLITRTGLFLFILSLGFITNSCKEEGPADNLCTLAFDEDAFSQKMDDIFQGQVMGYAFVVTRNGNVIKTGQVGKGRSGNDGDKNMDVDNRMHIASISKSITTIVTLRVLRDKGVDINTPVKNYLPPRWKLGPGFDQVTFYDLLHQSAGLNQFGSQGFNATKYDSLQAYCLAGAQQPKVRMYTNTHHGFLRVILPRLWDKARPADGNYDEDFCSNQYKNCVETYLFDEIAINTGDLKPPANNPNLAYSGPNDNSGSGGTSDYTNVAGGLGWCLSTWQIAKIWAYAWHGNLLHNQDRTLMIDDELGLWNSTDGAHGRYKCKLGGWNYDSNNPPDAINSCLMAFPDGIQIAVIINSPPPGGGSLRTIVRDAYDDSWTCH